MSYAGGTWNSVLGAPTTDSLASKQGGQNFFFLFLKKGGRAGNTCEVGEAARALGRECESSKI
jgi:hypothetical protein